MDPSESCSTKEAYCPRSVHVVAFCFLLILFFYSKQGVEVFFFFFSVIYTKGYYERCMFAWRNVLWQEFEV